MNLIIDIGNTLTKIAVFDGKEIKETFSVETLNTTVLNKIFIQNSQINSAVLSSVKKPDNKTLQFIKRRFPLLEFNNNTPIPIKIKYQTPDTLGPDRIAAVMGAISIYPQKNSLVIITGTCVTYNFISAKGEFMGGAISPGIIMRLKALHTFTEKLPLVKPKLPHKLIGDSTQESILSGVINGICKEIDGFIMEIQEQNPDLCVIISGGDMNYFEDKLKSSIFAVPNIILKGLNEILNYHDKTK